MQNEDTLISRIVRNWKRLILGAIAVAAIIVAAIFLSKPSKPQVKLKETTPSAPTAAGTSSVEEKEEAVEEVVLLKDVETIIAEIMAGEWGVGEERKSRLIEAGYNYDEIQAKINETYVPPTGTQNTTPTYTGGSGSGHLTMSGGVYYNQETGMKETWYSQRVLPGGGLNIPGRHVDSRGFVCDVDGYICVATNVNQYPKGTIINTSNGVGKVYDHGCAWGTVDVYTDW